VRAGRGLVAWALYGRCSESHAAPPPCDGDEAAAAAATAAAARSPAAPPAGHDARPLSRPASAVLVATPGAQATPEPEAGAVAAGSGQLAAAVASGAGRASSSKPKTPPYPAVCIGFFAKLSPNPQRSLAKPSFPASISPARVGLPTMALQSATAWQKEAIKQEQAELQALLNAAQCDGAVVMTSRLPSTAKPCSEGQ
jgi:hypothetical protein